MFPILFYVDEFIVRSIEHGKFYLNPIRIDSSASGRITRVSIKSLLGKLPRLLMDASVIAVIIVTME